jgi:hypothetical protein
MSLRRKLRSHSAVRYSNAESDVHAARVAERAERKQHQVEWIAVANKSAGLSPEEAFGLDWKKIGLPRGECFTFKDEQFTKTDGKEYESYLGEMRRERSWVTQARTRQGQPQIRRDGEASFYKRKRPGSIVELVVNVSPAQSLWLRDKSPRQIQAKIKHCLDAVGVEVREGIRWDLLGATVHYDSARPHLNLHVTRVLSDHTLASPARLRTIGSWSVAQWRLAKIGLGGSGNEVLASNLKRFADRHGTGAEPFDLRLHRVLDIAFESDFDGSGGTDFGLLRDCEKTHREWKKVQPQKILSKRGQCDAILVHVIRALRPFLPPPLARALRVINKVSEIVGIIESFSRSRKGSTGPSSNPKKELPRLDPTFPLLR